MSIKADKISLVDIDKLKFYLKNRNKHSPEQIAQLVKLLKYQGMRVPLIVDVETNEVIAGNGRLEAMRKMGWDKAPVSYQRFDSDEQRYAFSVSDNAIASWAELDLSGINTDLPDLGPDFDIAMLGLKDFKLDVSEFDEPEPKGEPKEKTAELGVCPNCGVFI